MAEERQQKINAMKMFLSQLGSERAAVFLLDLQESVEGLNQNNQKFVDAFSESHALLHRLYDNARARGIGETLDTVTRWEIDTTDYKALEDYLYLEKAGKQKAA